MFKKKSFLLVCMFFFSTIAYSQIIIPDKVRQGIVIEHLNGNVLAEKNADQKISPASMTKIMSAIIVFDQEEQFVNLMNEKAQIINMVNTKFSNSSGTFGPDNYSTVRDIALLSSYLINNYPQYYKYFKEKDFLWTRTGGNPIKQENRNTLLFTDEEVDGIKTGHLRDSKYSITVTKKKDSRRIIVVISGLPTMSSRAESSRLLLNNSLSKIDLFKIPYDKDKFKIKIWNGSSNYLDVRGTNKDAIFINLPKNLKNPKIRTELVYEYPLQIPIKKFEKVAQSYYINLLKITLLKK